MQNTHYPSIFLTGLLCLLLPVLSVAHAKTYRVLPLGELVIQDESQAAAWATATNYRLASQHRQGRTLPVVLFVDGAEGYVAPPEDVDQSRRGEPQGAWLLAVKLEADQSPVGQLRLATNWQGAAQVFDFELPPGDAVEMDEFEAVRQRHFASLAAARLPGSAWFRQQAGATDAGTRPADRRRDRGLDATFELFTGGLAIRENLALDRELILGATSDETAPVPLNEIVGVQVRAIDWSGRLAGTGMGPEPLSQRVPEAQAFLAFPSMEAFHQTIRIFESEGVPVLQTLAPRSSLNKLPRRYMGQMGLTSLLEDAPAMQSVGTVAITTGDPFLPSGSDIALLMATDAPEQLFAQLESVLRQEANEAGATAMPDLLDATESEGRYFGWQRPDRGFSSHLFQGEDFVAIANSNHQINALLAVADGSLPALGSTDEYRYFRERYDRDEAEDAFLFLSDATIRYWAGPKLRIAGSRRNRAAAALAGLTAASLAESDSQEDYSDLLGEVSQVNGGIRSEIFNTLNFITPVGELELETATAAEAQAYERWRRGYERSWAQVFDPIALRIVMGETSREIDLSVIPLRTSSEYAQWIDLVSGSALSDADRSGDGNTLLKLSLALNSDSGPFQQAIGMGRSLLPGLRVNPLGWVGNSISIFLEDGFFWEALAQTEDPTRFLNENMNYLPVGVRIANKDSVRLAMFITALRSMSEQSAPGLVRYETRSLDSLEYVAILPNGGGMDLPGVFYATRPTALLISINEDTLKQALLREQARVDADSSVATDPLPGQHLYAETYLPIWTRLPVDGDLTLIERQQQMAWSALPILNQWQQLAPDSDPVAFHQQHFGQPLTCPGGQGFRWNAAAHTMESVAFGHPLAARGETHFQIVDEAFERLRVGLTFEDDGLRAFGKMSARLPKPAPAELDADDSTDADSEDETPAAGLDWKAYHPYAAGSRWTYSVHTSWDGREEDEVIEVSSSKSTDSGTVIELTGYEQGARTFKETLLKSDEGIFYQTFESEDWNEKHPLPTLWAPPFSRAGERFESAYLAEVQAGEDRFTNTGRVTFRVEMADPVVVPAGEYKEAVKLVTHYRIISEGVIEEWNNETWLAEGIGAVKMRWNYTDGWELRELQSFTPGE